MLPWETVKSLISCDGRSLRTRREQLELGIFDISRAHFLPKADRVCTLPDEAKAQGEGDVVGRLNHIMYGFRDASNIGMRDWSTPGGRAVGKANPALFSNRQRNSRGAVHGDDFYVLANTSALDHIGKVLASQYKVRESHRLRFGNILQR